MLWLLLALRTKSHIVPVVYKALHSPQPQLPLWYHQSPCSPATLTFQSSFLVSLGLCIRYPDILPTLSVPPLLSLSVSLVGGKYACHVTKKWMAWSRVSKEKITAGLRKSFKAFASTDLLFFQLYFSVEKWWYLKVKTKLTFFKCSSW